MIELDKKVLQQGSSHLIVLPKAWCSFWNITNKSRMKMLANGIIILIPKNSKVNMQKIKKMMLEGL